MSYHPPTKGYGATWSDVNKVHEDVQRTKEEVEKNLEKERQARYKLIFP